MIVRTVIQLGLHTSAGWAYLARDDWREIHDERIEIQKVPDCFLDDPTPFRYFGLDCCPESIDYVAVRQQEYAPSAKFMCLGVSDKAYTNVGFGWNRWQDCGWHSIELHKNVVYLFLPFSMILRLLEIESLDILVMDIDGYEYLVFNDVQYWHTLPKCIVMELHDFNLPEDRGRRTFGEVKPELLNKLTGYGYKVVFDEIYEYGQCSEPHVKLLR